MRDEDGAVFLVKVDELRERSGERGVREVRSGERRRQGRRVGERWREGKERSITRREVVAKAKVNKRRHEGKAGRYAVKTGGEETKS